MTMGRKKGASTLSMVATKPSWRANHQTQRRTPLETAIGASRTAASATMTITRIMRKIRFLNGIAVRRRDDQPSEDGHLDTDHSWLTTIHFSSRLGRPNAAAAPCEFVVRVAPAKFSRLQVAARYLLLSSKPTRAALRIRFEHPVRKCGSITRFRMRAPPLVAAPRPESARAAAEP